MAGDAGYQSGRQFVQDQAMRAAGPDLASGNYQGALARLMAGGNPQLALAVAGLANSNRDFQFRQQEAQRAQGNADRSFAEGQRQFNVGAEGSRVPQGFQPDPTRPGSYRPIPGGPQDPAYIAETRKGPNLSVGDITKLSEEGGKYANLTGFIGTFKDNFGGKGLGVVGEAQNWAGRNLPPVTENIKNNAEQATWWQSYDRYKNVVRNDLFGSALTATEQAAFDKADINPGMQPDQIRKNLEIQRQVVEGGIKRKAGALVAAGHDANTIGKAYGLTPEQLGVPTKKGSQVAGGPVKVASQEEWAKLEKGTDYVAPDGSVRTKQ